MNLIRKLNYLERLQPVITLSSRRLASNLTNQEILNHRARLFNEEQNKQLTEIERTEKIQVNVLEPGQECSLIMNKNLSTPYSCSLRNK